MMMPIAKISTLIRNPVPTAERSCDPLQIDLMARDQFATGKYFTVSFLVNVGTMELMEITIMPADEKREAFFVCENAEAIVVNTAAVTSVAERSRRSRRTTQKQLP